MNSFQKISIVLFLLLFVNNLAQAQTFFYAKTNAKEVIAGSYFEVEYVLENVSGSDFRAPDFKGFQVISGPNRSSQISISNGRRSQKTGYSFTLAALNEGDYTIDPASIRVKRKIQKTESLRIKVVKGRSSGSVQEGQMEDVFVRAEISDSIAYPGQQVMLQYVLYTSKSISSYNFLSFPDLSGFYTQDIGINRRANRKVIDGVEYRTQALKKVAIFPQKLGEMTIDAAQLSLGSSRRDDPFNFFGPAKQFAVSSNQVVLKVIPLPENAPESFNGAIGKYRIQTNLNNRNITTDDATSLNLKISGTGLSKFIEAPSLDFDGKFDVYDPRVLNESNRVVNDDVISEKTFEYLLVPNEPGPQKVEVEFTNYNF